jgi:hypothetical protein
MKQEPPLDVKCRDKFLVQSVAVTSDKEFTNINQIVRTTRPYSPFQITKDSQWQHVDEAEKSSVQEKKIRVVYLSEKGSAANATPLRNGVNGISNGAVGLPLYSFPTPLRSRRHPTQLPPLTQASALPPPKKPTPLIPAAQSVEAPPQSDSRMSPRTPAPPATPSPRSRTPQLQAEQQSR